jgi:2-polyprenyl-3-methyl-5-hydroxy-6-metoxy-1,4-benzoquinol methylase
MPPTTAAPDWVEVSTCQLCGSSARTRLFREDRFEVVRCTECGLVYVTPRLGAESLLDVYSEAYWRSDSPKTKGYADYVKDEELYLRTFRGRARLVERHLARRPAKVLDVGCAAGYFLRVMRERGHDVYGVEVSAHIAQVAVAALGRERVHPGSLDSACADSATPGITPRSFDLVTMWDVIEHVADPQTLLRQAKAMLKPDGTLVLETQNIASKFARLLGRRWQHFKHEEHLYHFDPTTVARLLEQSGFTVVANTPRCGGKHVSFAFIAERAARVNRLCQLLLKPLAWFPRAHLYVNLRDEMIVVARPTGAAG